jgi:hypothetical protein
MHIIIHPCSFHRIVLLWFTNELSKGPLEMPLRVFRRQRGSDSAKICRADARYSLSHMVISLGNLMDPHIYDMN